MSPRSGRPGGLVLGIDIGGSGIKGAAVDIASGELASDRVRVATPQPATPDAVAAGVARVAAQVARQVADRLPAGGPVGVTFPGIIRGGVVGSAANMDHAWLGTDAATLLGERLERPVTIVNDADAAGIAEMTFGAGRGSDGVTVMVTFGTGIGSALFIDGRLVPNTELGHIIVAGRDGEKLAAASVKTSEMLSWKAWAKRVDRYLARLESLVAPDLIIVGGGVSKDHGKWVPRLHTTAKVVPAKLENEAGIVGAALWAAAHVPAKRGRTESP